MLQSAEPLVAAGDYLTVYALVCAVYAVWCFHMSAEAKRRSRTYFAWLTAGFLEASLAAWLFVRLFVQVMLG